MVPQHGQRDATNNPKMTSPSTYGIVTTTPLPAMNQVADGSSDGGGTFDFNNVCFQLEQQTQGTSYYSTRKP